MTVIQGGYRIHKDDCFYIGEVDSKGYVTLWGKKVYVGISAEVKWKKTYNDAQIDCQMGGDYLCKPVTCEDFWKALN